MFVETMEVKACDILVGDKIAHRPWGEGNGRAGWLTVTGRLCRGGIEVNGGDTYVVFDGASELVEIKIRSLK